MVLLILFCNNNNGPGNHFGNYNKPPNPFGYNNCPSNPFDYNKSQNPFGGPGGGSGPYYQASYPGF